MKQHIKIHHLQPERTLPAHEHAARRARAQASKTRRHPTRATGQSDQNHALRLFRR